MDTVGAGGKGSVQITPEAVVYVDRTDAVTPEHDAAIPEHDTFAVVTFKADNRTKSSLKTTASQGGFRWETRAGKTLRAGNTRAAGSIAPAGFYDGGGKPRVAARSFEVNTVAFDITVAQKGGTLVYVDGAGVQFRWSVPVKNAGGRVAKALKIALE